MQKIAGGHSVCVCVLFPWVYSSGVNTEASSRKTKRKHIETRLEDHVNVRVHTSSRQRSLAFIPWPNPISVVHVAHSFVFLNDIPKIPSFSQTTVN